MQKQYGGESLTSKVHEYELLRDFPEYIERDGSELHIKERDTQAPLTQEQAKRLNDAQKRLKLAQEFKVRG